MTDYGTIKIPEPAYNHHNERRQEMGLTWEQYINGEAPDLPNGGELEYDDVQNACRAAIRDELPDRIFG